jgi:hypothetical protein
MHKPTAPVPAAECPSLKRTVASNSTGLGSGAARRCCLRRAGRLPRHPPLPPLPMATRPERSRDRSISAGLRVTDELSEDASARRRSGGGFADEHRHAVERAAALHAIEPGELTLGSDNGSAFTARRFRGRLAELGIQHRRGGNRDPESQALIESWFGKLKQRDVWLNEIRDTRRRQTRDRRLRRPLPPPPAQRAQPCGWRRHLQRHRDGSDNTAAQVTPSCLPASGSTFPLGPQGSTRTIRVTCNAHDPAGNSARGALSVLKTHNWESGCAWSPPATHAPTRPGHSRGLEIRLLLGDLDVCHE